MNINISHLRALSQKSKSPFVNFISMISIITIPLVGLVFSLIALWWWFTPFAGNTHLSIPFVFGAIAFAGIFFVVKMLRLNNNAPFWTEIVASSGLSFYVGTAVFLAL